MCNWNTHEIVRVLLNDEALVQAKTRLARFLNISGDILIDLENSYKQKSGSYSYFCKVLEKWRSNTGNKAKILFLSNILRENGFIASADQLPSSQIFISATVFGSKDPIFNFVGREKELNELDELFIVKKSCVVLSSVMGGKGKTELCRRFIQQLPKDIETLVTWLSGDGEQQFHQSLSEIGQEMSVNTTDSEGKSLSVDKIIQNYSTKRKSKWLVIIDNVDEAFSDFYAAIDAFLRNGAFVLVTSRKSDIVSEKHIILKDFEDEEAWEFVRSSLDENSNPQELIVEICKCLQNYPLALQQAVAYIKNKQQVESDSYGIAEYLQELNLDTSKVLDHKILLTGYYLTLSKVFELTLNKLLSVSHNKALSLFQILSLVQSNGIETVFLKELFSFFELEALFDSSISNLKSFSLIEVFKQEVSVHQVVQKLARERMKSFSHFNLVVDKIFEKLKTDELTMKEILHVIQIWKNALTNLEIIKKASYFAVKICKRLNELSLYWEMKTFSEITLQQFVSFLGQDHTHTLIMQYQVAVALDYNGEYKEALVKLQEVWERQKKILGEEHEETLYCASQIAAIFWRLKRLDDSFEWHERVLKSEVKVLGENHIDTIITKNNMALVLDDQGKKEEALSIFEQILEWKERKFGNEHPSTLVTRHNIATCLYGQEKFVEVKKELEEVLKLRVKVLGEEHANTLGTKYWLSLTLYSLGQKAEALEMMKKVFISREKVLGQNHPQTNLTIEKISEWWIE